MEKNSKLATFKFSGIKNIINELEFKFINTQPISNKGKLDNLVLKGIYGPNGSGKTAFVEAIDLYKNIVREEYYIKKYNDMLLHNINQITNKVSLEATYYVEDEEKRRKPFILAHEIVLSVKDVLENKSISIESETLKVDNNIILESRNGVLENISKTNEFTKIGENINNTLNANSFICKVVGELREQEIEEIEEVNVLDKIYWVYETYYNALKINIISEEKDKHTQYLLDTELANSKKDQKHNIKDIERIIQYSFQNQLPDFSKKIRFNKKNKKKAKKDISRLEKFLKIFKPDLLKLQLETKDINDEEIQGDIFAVYDTGKINMEFESVGIKKLTKLFNVLRLLQMGNTVIIDELDAHIHDVALTELLNYILSEDKGQLIFTTHNIGTMDTLKKEKNVIDMLTLDGKIITWKQKGNATPSNYYRNGFLTNDFGYGIFDFIGALDE